MPTEPTSNYYPHPHSCYGAVTIHDGEAVTDLEVFCEEVRSWIVGKLAGYCGDVDVAEEAFQEAVVRTCRDWPQVRAMHAPASWVWRVAVNVVHDHHRREHLRRRHVQREGAEVCDEVDGSVPDVVVSLWLERALGDLPDDQRAVLEMRYLEDRSVRQVADALGRPEGTVKSLAHRGVRALRAGIT